MRLYKVTFENGTDERSVRWAGTQADANAVKKSVGPTAEPEVEEVDVPTDKPGLLAWLNANSRNAAPDLISQV